MDKDFISDEITMDEINEIVEIENEDGTITEYFLVGCMEYKGKNYAFFQPAEEVEGVSADCIIAYELSSDGNTLIEIESQDLYDEIMQEYYMEYEGEFVSEDSLDYIN